jgi:hypothetical protein
MATQAERIKALQDQVAALQAKVVELEHLTKPLSPRYPALDFAAQQKFAHGLPARGYEDQFFD